MSTLPQDRPVVVGAGLAGLLTALHLAPQPCLVLTTGRLAEHTSSALAQGGIAAALDDGDSPALHALDTLDAGAGLCDRDVVERVTAAAPAAVRHLVELGARLDRRPDGSLALALEGAHSRHRVAHAGGDATGRDLLRAVVAALPRSVTVVEHARVTRVLTGDDGEVSGVVVVHDGVTTVVRSRQVVLATGGVGGLFRHTTNPRGSRGQGLALAARAGAALRDLEMVQFHPTALDVGRDPMPLVSEAVRGEGARLVDDGGRPLLDDDLAPRDVVSRAVWSRLQRGSGVYLDARHALGARFADHFPTVAAACRAAGTDPARDLVPVRPAAHYHMGGVAVDGRGRTSVPGLWAVGEVAATGLHGANRLASNSLLEAAVYARWTAQDVAAQVARRPFAAAAPGRPNALVPAPAAVTEPVAWAGEVRNLLSHAVGVLRDGATLTATLATLQDAAHQRARTTGLDAADALDDATLVALLLTTAALRRTESRGAHSRTDHPTADLPVHLTLTLADALTGAPAMERNSS